MGGIVCAIRGGPSSQATIKYAVTLAQETQLPLYFLYVVNLDFMAHTSSSRVHTISGEMHQMGEFILLNAQNSAAKEGVDAEGLVRQGQIVQEMVGVCREVDADYIVMGRPRSEQEENVFTQELLAQFIKQIEQETGAKVVFPEGGDT
jgi:nucleotide-binding universal stress UspA family protein